MLTNEGVLLKFLADHLDEYKSVPDIVKATSLPDSSIRYYIRKYRKDSMLDTDTVFHQIPIHARSSDYRCVYINGFKFNSKGLEYYRTKKGDSN